jgi:hypothetical protein
MDNTPPPQNMLFHGRQVQYEAVMFNKIVCYRVKPTLPFGYKPIIKEKL